MSKSIVGILTAIADRENLAASDTIQRALTAPGARNARATDKAHTLPDGGGLALYIPATGAKVWRYRYRLDNGQQTLTIGDFPEVSLADARQAHRGARWLVERGIHPLEFVKAEIARMHEEELRQRMSTFAAVFAAWHGSATAAPRTIKHREAMAQKWILPTLGPRPIAEIRRRELADLLKAIDREFPVTAKTCRIIVKQVFDWAVEHELIAGNPTPSNKTMPRQEGYKPTHRKAIPLNDLGRFICAIKDCKADPLTRAAMQLVLFSWCRTSEAVGAEWSEFDLAAGRWDIPAARMKAGVAHTVFLSRQAIEKLQQLRDYTGGGKYLFPNRRRPDGHMSRMTLTNWRKRAGFAEQMDIHGLRAAGSTWANEARFRPDVIEAALAHQERDEVRAAYNRAGYAEELRDLWQQWADLLDQREAIERAANVVSIPRAA